MAVCSVARDDEEAFRDAVGDAATTIARRVREDRRRRDVAVEQRRRRRRRLVGRATPRTLLDAVALVPTGPLAMSPDFDGLVETSTSLGEAITEGDS